MKKYIIAVGLIFISGSAFSALWLINGNFSLSFTDVDEGNGLVVNRYYNSLGPGKGMFGYGWGSQMETRLFTVAGPLVMIEEAPSGGRSHYIDKAHDTAGTIADKLLKLTKASGNGKEYYNKLRQSILVDTTLLYEYAKNSRLQAPRMPEGTVLESVDRSDDKLKKTKNGYIRQKPNGDVDEFDNNGRVVKKHLAKGRDLSFSYNTQGNLQTISDTLGRSIKLYINNKGLLEKLVLYNNKIATYSYNDQNDLVASTGTDGKTYKYKYNSYHKIIEVSMGDAKWTVGYDSNTGKAIYQKTPDGWETFTEYTTDKSKGQYYENINQINKYNNEVVSKQYEIWKRPRPDGSLYVYKTRERSGGKEKTVTYTMCCSTPLVVSENGKITRFEYDKNGKLKKKVFPDGRILAVIYDDKDRITAIVNNNSPYKFKYNDKNQMVFAANNVIKFKLDYDGNGNVSKIIDSKGNELSVKYDESGRVSKVMTKYGPISVRYEEPPSGAVDNTGESAAKSNDTDRKLLDIQSAYQDYLDLISVFNLIDTDV